MPARPSPEGRSPYSKRGEGRTSLHLRGGMHRHPTITEERDDMIGKALKEKGRKRGHIYFLDREGRGRSLEDACF